MSCDYLNRERGHVSWKERKEIVSDAKGIYQAATAEQAALELKAFAKKWHASHPAISQTQRGGWERILPRLEDKFHRRGRPSSRLAQCAESLSNKREFEYKNHLHEVDRRFLVTKSLH